MSMNPGKPGAGPAPAKNAPGERAGAGKFSYFTAEGNLREALVDHEAEEQGKALKDVAPAQLRRYYEDVLNLRRRLEHESANVPGADPEKIWQKLRPEFRMLRAKAYYAHKRSEKVFTAEFRNFIEKHVRSVETLKEFLAFCRHFEAVVAFHKVYAKERH